MKGAACLPEPARRWVAPAAAPAAPPTGRVDLYVDASGSMVGYLRGSRGSERRPFPDLLAQLRAATTAGASQAGARSYHLFGRTILALPAGRSDSLLQEATYLCASPAPAPCNNQESRLDLVLAKVAASPPETLSVVVTDLWLSAAELEANGPVAMGGPVAQLLAEGRAFGVLGVRSPYDGKIYDLPSGATVPFQGDRPLYVLLAGPVERVVAFRDNLALAGIRGYGRREARFSLFTSSPMASAGSGRLEFTGGAFVERPVLPPKAGIEVRQAVLSSEKAVRERLRPGPGGPSAIRFTASPGEGVREGAVWRGPLTGVLKVWRLRGKPCDATAWAPLTDLEDGWTGTESREPGFSLPASEAAARLPKGTYLLSGELRVASLEVPNPSNEWMRSWSFNASTEPLVLARAPELFPTLNLAETAQILEAAADDAARRRPVALTGFAVVIRSEK